MIVVIRRYLASPHSISNARTGRRFASSLRVERVTFPVINGSRRHRGRGRYSNVPSHEFFVIHARRKKKKNYLVRRVCATEQNIAYEKITIAVRALMTLARNRSMRELLVAQLRPHRAWKSRRDQLPSSIPRYRRGTLCQRCKAASSVRHRKLRARLLHGY